MDKQMEYAKTNKDRFLNELFECLKIESISAVPEKEQEVIACGNWFCDKLKSIGVENVELKETKGYPAVYGDLMKAGKDKPTLMVYGHYDVQPVDPIEKWDSPPFEPKIKDDYIYCRGVADDKGQVLPHIFALESILKTGGSLPFNLKVFIEGEEEAGTGGTEKFVEDNKDLLACDAVVLSDTAWMAHDKPTIIYALRGIVYYEVKFFGPSLDLHSGIYGGRVPNTLNVMARVMSRLHDEDWHIAISGIYDDVVPLSDDEKKSFAEVSISDDALKKEVGVDALIGEKGFTSTERNWARPALDINGVWGGYMDDGAKTVISAEGGFKVSMRIVPNQDPAKITELLKKYIKSICPAGVRCEVELLHSGKPVMVKRDGEFIKLAQDSIEKAFGMRPILVREGASIPITETFKTSLKADSIMMGLGLSDDRIHSPNERFKVNHFFSGIDALIHFYTNAGK